MLASTLALLYLCLPADPGEAPPFTAALGSRVSGWSGDYTAPGLGGHVKLVLGGALGIELFNDNFLRPGELLRHDHVIGFSLYAPSLLGFTDGFITPTAGTCVDFRFVHASDGPAESRVLFGVSAGVLAELFVLEGFSFELAAEAYAYLGNRARREEWTVESSAGLGFQPVALVRAGVNRAL